jgi:D-alanine-D-alanine ligase
MAGIIVLYNTDYDEITDPGVDASSVETSAKSIEAALAATGYHAELVGLQGREVFDVLARLRAAQPELVFNLCESMAGDPRNEPTFAGLLDLFELPYTGADLPALAACLHKRRSKDILLGRGIPTPPHRYLASASDLADPALDVLDYPWFLKLSHEDASIGITEENLVRTPAALRARAGTMIEQYAQPVLAERYIDGREINVTLIGNDDELAVLPLHEIDFGAMPAGRPRIVSYAAKWEEDHVDYAGTKPVPLRDANPALVTACERVARGAWDAHGLRDYARVDLRVDKSGQPWVIDVNPNPDISPDAGVARSAAAAGMTYAQLIRRITETALRRSQRARA